MYEPGPSGPDNPVYHHLDLDLEEIRVLRLYGSSQVEIMLSGTLDIVRVGQEDRLQYETISYCWGKHRSYELMQINGCCVSVPRSATKVLRAFRHEACEDRVLWIDAVCINQDDLEERGQQVALIGEVFKNGNNGLVWLGEADDHTVEVLQCLETISKRFYPQIHDGTDGFRHILRSDWQYEEGDQSTPYQGCGSAALNMFFHRAWFHRVWVLQEALLPERVVCHCGKLMIQFDDLVRAAMVFDYDTLRTVPEIYNDLLFQAWRWNLVQQQGFARELPLVLGVFRMLEASDPRERYYALLGLLPRGTTRTLKEQLGVSYTKSIVEVSRDATLATMFYGENLAILVDVDQIADDSRELKTVGLPSWVLHLDSHPRADARWPMVSTIVGSNALRLPQSDRQLLLTCFSLPYVLLRGYCVSTVASVHTIFPSQSSPFTEQVDAFQALCTEVLSRTTEVGRVLAPDQLVDLLLLTSNTIPSRLGITKADCVAVLQQLVIDSATVGPSLGFAAVAASIG